MNIVFVSSHTPSTFIGGAEILTELIAKELVKAGHVVSIYAGGAQSSTIIDGINVVRLPLLQPKPFRTLMSPVSSKMLQQQLASEKNIITADIVHATDVDSLTLLSQWGLMHNKLVSTIQDYAPVCPAGDLLDGVNPCPNFCHTGKGFLCLSHRGLSAAKKFQVGLAYHVRKNMRDSNLGKLRWAICVSKFVEKELHRVAPTISTTVIGNCLSDEWFDKHNTAKDIDVLYVGRLAWYKGIYVLIGAIKMLSNDRHVRVYCVGGGENHDVESRVKKEDLENQFKFTGEVSYSQVKEYYKRAKIVVAPSIWPEPCGRTIIEGMAMGIPVIATSTGGTPESIHHGVDGLLIPTGNARALKESLTYLLDNPAIMKRIGTQAQKKALSLYRTKSILSEYVKFYSLILSKK